MDEILGNTFCKVLSMEMCQDRASVDGWAKGYRERVVTLFKSEMIFKLRGRGQSLKVKAAEACEILNPAAGFVPTTSYASRPLEQ